MKNQYRVTEDGSIAIQLQHGLEALIDATDLPIVEIYDVRWCAWKCRNTFYVVAPFKMATKANCKNKLHRLLMQPAPGLVVDHINHNGLDNRRSNLRLATVQQNNHNQYRSKNKSSVFKGVYSHEGGNRWRVQIFHNNKKHHIGLFDSEVDAAKAYDKVAKHMFGSFAYLNFPAEAA